MPRGAATVPHPLLPMRPMTKDPAAGLPFTGMVLGLQALCGCACGVQFGVQGLALVPAADVRPGGRGWGGAAIPDDTEGLIPAVILWEARQQLPPADACRARN